jgi:hypothetical protein
MSEEELREFKKKEKNPSSPDRAILSPLRR